MSKPSINALIEDLACVQEDPTDRDRVSRLCDALPELLEIAAAALEFRSAYEIAYGALNERTPLFRALGKVQP